MEKEKFLEEFNRQQHRLGRIMLIAAAVLLLAVPFLLGGIYGALPDLKSFLNGFIKVGMVYIPVGIVEFLVYAPMLGKWRKLSDLSYRKRNKPENPLCHECQGYCQNRGWHRRKRDYFYVKRGIQLHCDHAGDLCRCPSSGSLTPVLENPVLTPAFDTVVPALFGALGLKYFRKSTEDHSYPSDFHDSSLRTCARGYFTDQYSFDPGRRNGSCDRICFMEKE